MMRYFNVNGGGIKAKKQLEYLTRARNHYCTTGKPIPNPLRLYDQDYRILEEKARECLRKAGEGTAEKLTLTFGQVELISTRSSQRRGDEMEVERK